MSEAPEYKTVKLDWESDGNFHFPLGTNMLVNFDSEHFYIRSYQATPPAILGGEMPDSVKAKLITGIAIPVSKMRGVAEALAENYQRYLERKQRDTDFGLEELGIFDDNNPSSGDDTK